MTNIKYCLCVFSLLLLFPAGCSKKKKPEIPPRPVETAIATKKDVPIYIESFGFLSSPNNVDIRSQVTGKLQEAHFNEGDMVKKGDLLFTIDESEYEANLEKALASVAQDMVDLKLKKDLLDRNTKLFEKNLISAQDFENYQTDVASTEQKLKLDKAEAELQKIYLQYCKIISPIDGVTGKRLVDPGNIVSANTGPVLVNVKTMDPLYVDFTIIEDDLEKARTSMSESKLTVVIMLNKDQYNGQLQFLDNAVDDTTGTVSLRGIVDNKENKLWAGQFVRVKLILGTEKDAILVPVQAVQIGQKGEYLFAVTPDNKADLRIVTVGSKQGDDIVIKEGVKEGEKVVTMGQMQLSPGVPVAEKNSV